MGCDIHAHVEIKIDGEWLHYSPANIRRNYLAFARMANVRNPFGTVVPVSMPRGLPDDISLVTKLHRDIYGVDGHSDSWFSHDEYVSLIDWLNEELDPPTNSLGWMYSFLGNAWLFGNTVYFWKKRPEIYPECIQDVRLVFWFDN